MINTWQGLKKTAYSLVKKGQVSDPGIELIILPSFHNYCNIQLSKNQEGVNWYRTVWLGTFDAKYEEAGVIIKNDSQPTLILSNGKIDKEDYKFIEQIGLHLTLPEPYDRGIAIDGTIYILRIFNQKYEWNTDFPKNGKI